MKILPRHLQRCVAQTGLTRRHLISYDGARDLRIMAKDPRKDVREFSYSKKKDYIEWLTEAKREETRRQRLKTAIEWMARGKLQNWKYC